jgi:hypothetical protein
MLAALVIRVGWEMNERSSLLLTAAVALAWAATARAADDWQYWNQFVLRHKFNDRFSLGLTSEQKFEDDFSHFYLYNVSVVPIVRLAEGVALGAGYRREQKEESGRWEAENRLLFPLALEWDFPPWVFQWRNQLEYRDLETRDRWRLRGRLVVERPVKVGSLTVTPFVGGEVFYDLTVEQINQRRLAAGVSLPLRQHADLSVFYLNKAEKDGDWSTVNVLGTEVAFEF